MSYEEVAKLALEKLQEYKQTHEVTEYALDVKEFASQFGIVIIEDDMNDRESGMLLISPDLQDTYGSDKVIIVNAQHSDRRKRFTIAHELGHYFLEAQYDSGEYIAYRDIFTDGGVRSIEEKHANYFASVLLMPPIAVRSVLEEILEFSPKPVNLVVRYMSDQFNVSQDAARARLQFLGVIK